MHCLYSGDVLEDAELVFVHANGFNARTYLPLLSELSKTCTIAAPDLRGHGLSTLPDHHRHRDWRLFRDDLIALLETFKKPPLLVGHSMGGTSSLLAAAKRPDLVRGLLAFDPPIMPRLMHFMIRNGMVSPKNQSKHPLVRGAKGRRHHFASREAAVSRYENKRPFASWQQGFLQNYMNDGLLAVEDGFSLACDPQWEAHNYMAHGHDIWGAVASSKRRPC
jgi:pimeloyl-ACP methyl ester carboxylesterase